MEHSSFGNIVRSRRHRLGLTQAELARRAGCATITVRKIEADDIRPSVQIAQRLAESLGIPREELKAFVRLARLEKPIAPLPNPPPSLSEIGAGDLSGRAIRGYQLGERIGKGGFGVVYRALQPSMNRHVAVKIVLPRFANHPDFIRRFESEARLVASLEHPHIIPLYDFWREPNIASLIMRYLKGGSLKDRLENGGPLGLEKVGAILEQVGAALQTAHKAGIVHRDIKPANILLDEEDNAYIGDFGIAKNIRQATGDTDESGLVWSPYYAAPEQILADPLRPQTDIYSLGLVLYELLTGHKPFGGPLVGDYIDQQLNQEVPPLGNGRNGFPPGLDGVIRRATAKEPLARFPDVSAVITAYRQTLTPIMLRQPRVPLVEPVENPFKGLRPFAEADAADFYGRETLIQDLLGHLGEENDLARFLTVVGPSGSGKSSVVRAGLLPALRRGGLPGSEHWFITDMVPGSDPFRELERALLRVAIHTPGELLDRLRTSHTGLLEAAAALLPDDEHTDLVLVVDQFEELFLLVEEEDTRTRFLESLVTAVLSSDSRLRLIITLRADFIDRPLHYIDFGELVRQRSVFVLPLTPDELEEAITRPVQRLGLAVEPELTASIIHDDGSQLGALPLLQYALTELFDQRQDGKLTLAAYRESGGVRGALARRAEQIYEHLSPEARLVARQLFLRLVQPGEDGADTRRRVLRSELRAIQLAEAPEETGVDLVIDRFGSYRLLTFDHDPASREPTVEVAHEALLDAWERLRRWLGDSRGEIRRQRLLAQQARDWRAAGQDPGLLMSGTRLIQYEDWTERSDIALTRQEKFYLYASLEARRQRQAEEENRRQRELETARRLAAEQARRAEEQSRAAGRLRRLAIGLALVLFLALGLGWLANNQRAISQASFLEAERIRLAAQAQNALDRGEGGELPALLALRSLALGYSPEADGALMNALRRGVSRQQYLGHTDTVNNIQFMPDGRAFLTAGHDGTLRLWQTQSGATLRVLSGHSGPIWRVRISSDGRTALSSGIDGTARLFDLETGAELQRFNHDSGATAVDFSPDGRYALTGSGADLYLWELATGDRVRRFEGHTEPVFTGSFSPDSRYVASAGEDRIMRLWDVNSGAELRQFIGHSNWIGHLDFSPDGRYLLTGSADQTARIWDVESGLEIRRLVGHTEEVYTANFSSDGLMVLTSGQDRTARLWDTTSGQEIRQIRGHTGAVYADFSPDGRLIATTSEDRSVRLWDVNPLLEPQIILRPSGGHSGNFTAAALSPDRELILTGESALRLWPASGSESGMEISLQVDAASSLAFSPDGSQALVGGANGTAYLINTRSIEEVIPLLGHQGEVRGVAFSPDSRLALTGGDGGLAILWEAATGREVRRLTGQNGPLRSVAFSPDGRQMVTGGEDGVLTLWAAESGEQLIRFDGQNGPVTAVAFAPDNQTVASGHGNQTAVIWDGATGQLRQHLNGHTDQVTQVAFAPDGRYLLTGSADQTARLWDAQTGELLHQYIGHVSPLLTIGFSADGRQVFTADRANVYAWRTTLADAMTFACSQLPRDLSSEERAFYNITADDPTCPEPAAQVAQAEPAWTPIPPAAREVPPLSLEINGEVSGELADTSAAGEMHSILVDDIRDPGNIIPIAGSRAYLSTDDQGATIQVHTSGLTPGHAVTLWMVFFNQPENCSDGACGPDDAFPPPGNTAAGATVFYGDGLVIGANGRAYFAGHVTADEDNPPFSIGLVNPRTAEAHFILRDHGPAIDEIVYGQITTPGVGCNNFPPFSGEFTCVDVQAGIFRQAP